MQIVFDKKGHRASKARLGKYINKKPLLQVMKFLMVLIILVGAGFWIFLGQLYAFILAPGIIIFMIYTWIKDDIAILDPDFSECSDEYLLVHSALEHDVLGNLDDAYTVQGIWDALKKSQRAYFFMQRFGVHPTFIEVSLQSINPDATPVWEKAYQLSLSNNEQRITAGTLLLALLSQLPNYEGFLSELHIDFNDLMNGLKWQAHLDKVIKSLRDKMHLGGIARDWNAGYTPNLDRAAENVSHSIQAGGGLMRRDIDLHQEVIYEMVKVFSGGGNNIALIGDVGIGKTTTVNAFAQHLLIDPQIPNNLKYHQVYRLDASTLISNAQSMPLETIINLLFNEAIKAKNIVLFIDDAELFFQNGTGSIDLSNVLLPILERSNVRIILSMTNINWQHISQASPALSGLVNQITIPEAHKEDVIRILEDQVLLFEARHKVIFKYQALVESYRLAEHYISDSVFPGKALKILEASVRFTDNGYVTEESVQKAIESMMGVKVQKANVEEKDKLLNLEDEIHKRMINQTRAVKVVADALRRARAGVSNPNKPFGTFLFLGPTGVGKTELSKSIADIYFGGEGSMVRIDMNQYNSEDSVSRLLVPVDESGTALIPQIRKQPFSVVLFDEIEKAHPKVLDIFLQLLDEGVLRDADNKEASFKDAIVIATSNAGAQQIREHIESGEKLEDFEKPFIDSLIDSGQFKPEFLNRFDETVVFRPLNKDELHQVVDLIMSSINKNLERQKVSVSLTDDAKQWLVDNGYDPRLGARPLRRMAQRTVENIVAKKLLDSSFTPGSNLELNAQELEAVQ